VKVGGDLSIFKKMKMSTKRKLEPESVFIPYDCQEVILSFVPWYNLFQFLSVSGITNSMSSRIIKIQFEEFVKKKLPQICFGRRRKVQKGEVITDLCQTCIHKEKNTVCYSRPFIPRMNMCVPDEVEKYKKCPNIVNTIQRPSLHLGMRTFISTTGRQEDKNVKVRLNQNPKWLCRAKTINISTKNKFVKHVYGFMDECFNQMKSCFVFSWTNLYISESDINECEVYEIIEIAIEKFSNKGHNNCRRGDVIVYFNPHKMKKLQNLKKWLIHFGGIQYYQLIRNKLISKCPKNVQFKKYS